jgi:O-antigen/teichoic acid export membrane protein
VRRPAAAGLIGQGAEVLSQVLLVSAVPALLGPAAYGEFALALSLVMLASAAVTLGGPAILTRYVPAAAPEERDAVARAIVRRLGTIRAAQVGLVAALGAGLALAAPDTFAGDLVAAVVIAIALDVAATLAFQAALGFGGARLWSFRFALQNLVLAGAALVLHEAGGAVWAIPLASGLALCAGLAAAGPRLRAAPPGAPVPDGALRFGLLQAIGSLLQNLQHRGGVIVVALLGGSSVQTGFASLALGIGLAGVYGIRQAFTVELPGLVARSRDDPVRAEHEARRLALLLLAPAAPAAIAAALWGADLLALVAGEEFRGAAAALGFALALVPLAPALALAGQIAALRLRPEARVWSAAAGLAAFAIVAAIFVPGEGAPGATAAVLAGAVTSLLVTPLVLRGALQPPLLAAALACAGAVWFLS